MPPTAYLAALALLASTLALPGAAATCVELPETLGLFGNDCPGDPDPSSLSGGCSLVGSMGAAIYDDDGDLKYTFLEACLDDGSSGICARTVLLDATQRNDCVPYRPEVEAGA